MGTDRADAGGAELPAFSGIRFRRVRGPEDFAPMAEVITRSREADGVELAKDVEALATDFERPGDFDPESDVLVAEAEGRIVGLARMWRHSRADGTMAYEHSVELIPECRGRGLREALFEYNEGHARELAMHRAKGAASRHVLWANDEENDWKDLVLRRGYHAVQHEIDLIRPLADIPTFPLPEGVVVHPVTPAEIRAVWDANRRAWRGTWDYSEERWDDAHLETFRHAPEFQPALWQVAWDGDMIVGMVLPYILPEENRRYGWRRGHAENVYVREGYRGRGLARALLARALSALKDRGMEEAMLSMEVENPHNPLRLYEGMGFRTVSHFTWYEKPL